MGGGFLPERPPPSAENGNFLRNNDFGGVLRGRVVVGSDVDAMKLPKNTAEMQAIVESFLFILAQVEADAPIIPLGEAIVIHSDSRYAVDLVRHGTRSTTNFLLRDFLIHLWKKAKAFFIIRIVWVRGHDKDWGNEQADKHAGEGADIKDEDHVSMGRPSDFGIL